MKKVIITLLSLVLLFAAGTASSQKDNQLKVFYPGEYIEYEVSFMGIKLGNIIITSKEYTELNGKKVVTAKAEMRSAKGIPFVDLHAFFDSWISPGLNFSHQFYAKVKNDEKSWFLETYLVNNDAKEVKYEKWLEKEQLMKKDMKFESRVLDGCSLFFFARQFTDLKKTVRVPTLMNESISFTNLNFHGEKQNVEIDAVKYPVKVLYFDGRADWEGIYGLKGYFQGWFSDDEARVPIKALMNVYVGNVEITLTKWKRGDWQPPKGK